MYISEDVRKFLLERQPMVDEMLAKIPKKKCCFCGEEFEGIGNNPAPVKATGSCCNTCNYKVVIPAKLKAAGLA